MDAATTDTGTDLLAAILAAPADDNVRLVYADYLQEQGASSRAEFIRVQVELARGPEGIDCERIFSEASSSGAEHWSCALAPELALPPVGATVTARLNSPQSGWLTVTGAVCAWSKTREFAFAVGARADPWRPELTRREGELLPAFLKALRTRYRVGMEFTCSRGFANAVMCTAADWFAHAAAITASHPIERVTLTTTPVVGGRFGANTPITAELLGDVWPGIAFTLPPVKAPAAPPAPPQPALPVTHRIRLDRVPRTPPQAEVEGYAREGGLVPVDDTVQWIPDVNAPGERLLVPHNHGNSGPTFLRTELTAHRFVCTDGAERTAFVGRCAPCRLAYMAFRA